MTPLSRRNFFKIGTTHSELIRPPWAVAEEQFIECCTRCDECIKICPEKVIIKGDGGFPQINFSDSGCELCEDCLNVCAPKALFKLLEESPGWTHKVKVTDKCLPYQGVICRSCYEACDEEAISFTLEAGKVAGPEINLANCNGCGFCIAICPVDAILIQPETTNQNN